MHIKPIEVNQDDVRYPVLNTAVEVFKGALARYTNVREYQNVEWYCCVMFNYVKIRCLIAQT